MVCFTINMEKKDWGLTLSDEAQVIERVMCVAYIIDHKDDKDNMYWVHFSKLSDLVKIIAHYTIEFNAGFTSTNSNIYIDESIADSKVLDESVTKYVKDMKKVPDNLNKVFKNNNGRYDYVEGKFISDITREKEEADKKKEIEKLNEKEKEAALAKLIKEQEEKENKKRQKGAMIEEGEMEGEGDLNG